MRSLVKNIGWLSVFQVINLGAPLVVLPYLSRKLGVTGFGEFALAVALIQLSYVITDYGFSLSGIYRLARANGDKVHIERILSGILSAKIILINVVLSIGVAFVLLSDYRERNIIVMLAMLSVIGQAFQLVWFFQGVGRLASYVMVSALCRAGYVILIILFVDNPADGAFAIFSLSLSNLVSGMAALLMLHMGGYRLRLDSFKVAVTELKLSFEYFTSRIAAASFTSAATLISGIGGAGSAALYASADQCYRAFQSMLAPINQALFPMMARDRNWRTFALVVSFVLVGLLILASFFIKNADSLIIFLFGDEFAAAAETLAILTVALCVNFLSVCLGYPAFAAINRVDVANKTVVGGAMFFVALGFVLNYFFKINQIVVANMVLCTEAIILSSRIICLVWINKTNNINRM